MGKNKRSSYTVVDTRTNKTIEVDSEEEIYFYEWCLEAVSLGIICDFVYQPTSFKLFDAATYKTSKGKTRSLIRDHIYTPDFKIMVKDEFEWLKDELKKSTTPSTVKGFSDYYIDVKGSFARNGGDRAFAINQKWTYDKYSVFVYKLCPKEFFKKAGVPEKCRLTRKTKKPSRVFSSDEYKSMSDVFGIR